MILDNSPISYLFHEGASVGSICNACLSFIHILT
jgi:hypothetical protein